MLHHHRHADHDGATVPTPLVAPSQCLTPPRLSTACSITPSAPSPPSLHVYCPDAMRSMVDGTSGYVRIGASAPHVPPSGSFSAGLSSPSTPQTSAYSPPEPVSPLQYHFSMASTAIPISAAPLAIYALAHPSQSCGESAVRTSSAHPSSLHNPNVHRASSHTHTTEPRSGMPDSPSVRPRARPQMTRRLFTHRTQDALLMEMDWDAHRYTRDMRGRDGETVWYRTCGPFTLSTPPPSLVANVDDLYIHSMSASVSQMWVVDADRNWIPARRGDRQPSDRDRRLSLCRDGDPSWIKKASYSVYRSRRKKAFWEEN